MMGGTVAVGHLIANGPTLADLGATTGKVGAGALAVAVIIGAVVTIRDKLLDAGVDKPRWMMQMARRAAVRRTTRDAAFLESEFFEHVGNATDVAIARRKHLDGALEHPDRKLIAALKGWTLELEEGVDFYGLRHYVNTMGAISSSEEQAASFATIAYAWLTALQDTNAIKPFDCLLSIKDGNPILVHNLAQRMRRSEERPIRAVFCKGESDSARVSQHHETDFEGLRAFRDHHQLPRCRDRFRAVAIDDNCASGKSLFAAIQRFNRFVAEHDEEYPFYPVDSAVVLFVVKSPKPNAFVDSDINLHALLALGDTEMAEIRDTKRSRQLARSVANFKDSPACKWSWVLDTPTESPDSGVDGLEAQAER